MLWSQWEPRQKGFAEQDLSPPAALLGFSKNPGEQECTWHALPGVSKLTCLIWDPICCSPTLFYHYTPLILPLHSIYFTILLYFTITLYFTIYPHVRTKPPHCPGNLCMNPGANLMVRKRMETSFSSSQDTVTQHTPSRDSTGASSARQSLRALSILKFCQYFNCRKFPAPFIGSNLCSSKCLCQLLKNCTQPIKRAFNPRSQGGFCVFCADIRYAGREIPQDKAWQSSLGSRGVMSVGSGGRSDLLAQLRAG